MGLAFGKLSSYFSKKNNIRILIFGLDAAGKTTILYMAKLGEIVTTIPTIGFNVETLTYGKLNITAWDVGGRDKGRVLWRHYYEGTSAVVCVVDSNDRERITEVCEELHQMVNAEELRTVPILIFANKQDLPNALGVDELKEKLNLSKLDETKRKWHLQSCVATKNQGIHEGFEWLANTAQSQLDLTESITETMNDSKSIQNNFAYRWDSIDVKALFSKFI